MNTTTKYAASVEKMMIYSSAHIVRDVSAGSMHSVAVLKIVLTLFAAFVSRNPDLL